jgi:hypothetical protein
MEFALVVTQDVRFFAGFHCQEAVVRVPHDVDRDVPYAIGKSDRYSRRGASSTEQLKQLSH